MFRHLYQWLDERVKLTPVRIKLLEEPIPGGASWIYVFGSVTLFLFVLQLISGMFLSIYYSPSPDHAYDSIVYIQQEVPFGSFVRGLHHWGASLMMIAVGLHMLQVFLYGAYKRPREVMWIVGVFLFLLTLAFGFSGYLLPWDQKAYWATQVGINIVGTIPLAGDFLARIIRGGTQLGAMTLSRFFALHVLFLPWATVLLIALHLFILRRVGPAGPWDHEKAQRISEPFYPRQVFMDSVAMLGVFVVLIGLASMWVPPLADRANPSDTRFIPVPEWYFLFYYQLLKYFEGPWQVIGTVVLPLVFFTALLLLPFLDRTPKRDLLSRRGVIFLGGLFLVTVFGLLGVSIKQNMALTQKDPAVERGKQLYAQLGCSGCHRIHGQGALVGPDLSYVGDIRDADWLIRHFKDPQAVVPGSIMPAYPLSNPELNDLTAYMLSLRKSLTP